jgi:diadenosine tetraphosphate (Ap4A) HIT family hydrolase
VAAWEDAEAWDGLVSGRTCPICVRGEPTHLIAEVEGCWLTMGDEAAPALPGTCALFHPRHVVELHELSAAEAAAFMAAVQRVTALLQEASGAVKINYEVHGNTIPHLHMHFFPRYRGDPFDLGPVDPRRQGGPDDLRRHLAIRRKLVEALA